MAEFRIDQPGGAGVGVAGESRVDLLPGFVVELHATPVAGATFTWEILDKVNAPAAALTATTGLTVNIGSVGGDIPAFCGFMVRLTQNLLGVITVQDRVVAVRSAAAQIRPPLFGEQAPSTQTLNANNPALSTDNAVYADLAGLGVPGNNPFGWREWAWEIAKSLEATASVVGTPAPLRMAGATRQIIGTIGSEAIIGNFGAFDPTVYATPALLLEATFVFVPATAGSIEVRLYDMGTRLVPAPGTLRATIQTTFLDAGIQKCVSAPLTVSATPGVNTGDIQDAERIYELRAILIGANPGDALELGAVNLVVAPGLVGGGNAAPNSPSFLTLGAAAGLLAERVFTPQKSVTGTDNGPGSTYVVELDGDDAAPGPDMVYGTDGAGVKGWKPDPTGGGAPSFQWNAGGNQDVTKGAYNNWADLYAAVSAMPIGSRKVRVNAQDSTPIIPAGDWDLNGWHFVGPDWNTGYLTIDDAANFDVAAAVTPTWQPNDGRFSLTFEDLYVDLGKLAGNTFVDMSAAPSWAFVLTVIRSEIDSYVGGSFVRDSSLSNGVRVRVASGAFFGGTGTDGVFDTGTGAVDITIFGPNVYLSPWAVTGSGFLNFGALAQYRWDGPFAYSGSVNFYDATTTHIIWGDFDGPSGFQSWSDLYQLVTLLPISRRVVHVDSAFVPLNVPSGTWDLTGWRFVGADPSHSSTITFLNGGAITVGDAGVTFESMTVISNLTAPIAVPGTNRTDLRLTNCVVNCTADVLFDASGAASDVHLHTCDVDISASANGFIYWDGAAAQGYLHLKGRLDGTATMIVTDVGHSLLVTIDDPAVGWPAQTLLLGTVTYDVAYAKKQRYAVAGAAAQVVAANVLTPEIVVGGFVYGVYNPINLPGRDGFVSFEAMATAPTVNAVVKLYDIGAPGALAAPSLVTTLTVPNGDGGSSQLLVVTPTPTPASDEIYDTERLYEIRVVSDAAENIQLYWAGMKVN